LCIYNCEKAWIERLKNCLMDIIISTKRKLKRSGDK